MEGPIFPLSAITLRRKWRKNAAAAGLDALPQQGARHTWASAWLRQHGDIDRWLQAGHESPPVLWNHYYQAMTPKDAAAFWAIYPPAAEERRIVAFPGRERAGD